MIKLKTEVLLPDIPVRFSYRHKSMMMGSCFTESIGTKYRELCFPIDVNPFGIIYNPISIGNSLDILMAERMFSIDDLFYSNGLWNSFYHHSRFSNPDQEECIIKINNKIKEGSKNLRESSLLFLTLGTSWVFEDKESGRIVSNCHKLPASTFKHYRISTDQIVKKWIDIIENLFVINPSIKLVFTVSPIRHLKDGEHENQLSKANLLLAIDELITHFSKDRIFYFPSYEIVLDELRDYRFYAKDMVHLTEVAIDIIREKFSSVFIDKEDMDIAVELEKLLQGLNHRPAHPHEKSYQEFIDNQLEKISQLKSKYPYIDLQKILNQFYRKKEVINF